VEKTGDYRMDYERGGFSSQQRRDQAFCKVWKREIEELVATMEAGSSIDWSEAGNHGVGSAILVEMLVRGVQRGRAGGRGGGGGGGAKQSEKN
jgi:hypothetical protein